MKHVISAKQFTDRDQVDGLMDVADRLRVSGGDRLRGRVLGTLFYEPSTRTRLSFEAAMLRLGGGVVSAASAEDWSSAAKGESIEDTARVLSSYVDCLVLRHPERGAAARAASHSAVPVINAGDGDGEHPTQALLDLYTVRRELGRLDGLRYALVGDLRYGRTVHSLVYLLGLCKDVHLTLVSPYELAMPQEVLNFITAQGVPCHQVHGGVSAVRDVLAAGPDVVYLTRTQLERGKAVEDDHRRFGREEMDLLPPTSVVLHPLPRRGELAAEVDGDCRAAYFRQAENGLWLRAALLDALLGRGACCESPS